MSTSSAPRVDDLVGSILGGAYRVLRRLDEGGMGTVFEAEHLRLKRSVAVKVMAEHLADEQAALQRFSREAEIISQLNHPHIVQVHDFNTTEQGQPYLVMELLRGNSLEEALAKHRPLGIGPALRIAIQIASALAAAHHSGIVHRDLKPANIFLVDAGDQLFVKLLDFGISKKTGGAAPGAAPRRKLTGEFDILGTPDYMPPEQAAGKTAQVDARGDQYALAMILYELLTGRVPFEANDVMQLLQKVIREIPPAPSTLRREIPPSVDEAIAKALSKDPEERFMTIVEFAEVLEEACTELTIGSNPQFPQTQVPAHDSSRRSGTGSRARRSSETRRTSWHSKNPVTAVEELVDRSRQEMSFNNLSLAVSCAESALDIAQGCGDPAHAELLKRNATFLERVFTRQLGSLSTTLALSEDPPAHSQLSPEQAYLLSRLDGGLSLEEALDLSHLSRAITLGQLVSLMRMGHICLRA
ncbi:MAG: serine/threonine protein kinase [Polyangiaceae bacterium]|nr:serine/threonine protein kinase [Polyangiaceae bacterium]